MVLAYSCFPLHVRQSAAGHAPSCRQPRVASSPPSASGPTPLHPRAASAPQRCQNPPSGPCTAQRAHGKARAHFEVPLTGLMTASKRLGPSTQQAARTASRAASASAWFSHRTFRLRRRRCGRLAPGLGSVTYQTVSWESSCTPAPRTLPPGICSTGPSGGWGPKRQPCTSPPLPHPGAARHGLPPRRRVPAGLARCQAKSSSARQTSTGSALEKAVAGPGLARVLRHAPACAGRGLLQACDAGMHRHHTWETVSMSPLGAMRSMEALEGLP